MRPAAWLVVASMACSLAGAALAAELHEGPPATNAPVRPATPSSRVTVQIVSATLGEDCGGLAPSIRPRSKRSQGEARHDASERHGVGRPRPCQQTSMQLSVVAPAGVAATELVVKSVELFDEAGTRVGTLAARAPTVWSADAYRAWDAKVAPGQSLAVSYALSEPDWSSVADRWNKTFVLRAVLTIGGADQTVERDVSVESPATSLPPNVRT